MAVRRKTASKPAALLPILLGVLCVKTEATERFLFSHWTVADGLPHSTVDAVTRTADGYLWLGTNEGLARFDGLRFRVWNADDGLPGDAVIELEPGKEGLWVATDPGGLALFDGEALVERIEGIYVDDLLEDDEGALWIAAPDGLLVLRPGEEASRESLGDRGGVSVYTLLAEGRGGLLAGHRYGLSRRSPDGRWSAVAAEVLEGPVTGLASSPGGDLWVGAANGLWRLASGDWRLVEAEPGPYPHLFADPSGAVWTWVLGDTLRRFDGESFRPIASLDALSDTVLTVAADGADTLWVGTAAGGLYRLRRPIIEALTENDGLPSPAVHGVLETRDGSLWLGTYKRGVARWDDRGLRIFGVADGLPDDLVLSLGEDHSGRLWVGTALGLAVREGEGFRAVEDPADPHGDAPLWVSSLLPEEEGSVLVGTRRRLLRYRDGSFETVIPHGTFESPGIEALYRDREGDVWVGGTGICRLRGSEVECLAEDAVPAALVSSFFETPRGDLWAGTYGSGLCRIEGETADHCLAEAEGVPHRTVHRILLDRLGWVWLTSNRGLARVRLTDLEAAFADGSRSLRVDTFDTSDGLPSAGFSGAADPAGVVLRDGRLALPTLGGLALVDPLVAAEEATVAPRVHVESIEVDGVERPLAANLTLEPGTKRFTFRYTGIHPPAPEKVRFRYRLEGYDATWVAAGGERTATYTRVPPGRYRFRVQASVGGGDWSREAAAAVRLRPTLLQAWWFRLSALGVTALVLAVLYRMRVRHLLELERLRVRIAADLHDELGSELSGIALATGLLSARADLPESARQRLAAIRSSSGRLVERLRDIVWLVEREPEAGETLVERLRSMAARLLPGLEVELTVDATVPELRLDPRVRRDVVLLYRELLTNVARHAQARRVRVRVGAAGDELRLEVADDGVGFDPERSTAGRGLEGVRNRVDGLTGRVEIAGRPGSGSRVTVTVPMTRSGGGHRAKLS